MKQAGRIWNKTLYKHFLDHSYISLESEPSIYTKQDTDNNIIIIAVHVDDLQIASNNQSILDNTKNELKAHFKMTDLGEVHHILGLRIL